MEAELVVRNGIILSLGRGTEGATALAVRGGRIVCAGGDDEMAPLQGTETQVIDLHGRAVMAGLIDGHAHMDREGLKTVFPSLAGATTVDDILELVAAEVSRTPPGEWIVTMPVGEPPYYWGVPGNLAEKRFPNRWDLDRVAPENPVYIRPIWGFWRHTQPLVSVANSRALEIAGITRDSLPPTGTVQIEKDFDTGDPTGIFIEWTMVPIVELSLMRDIPRFAHAHRVAGIRQAQRAYHAYGTTGIYEEHGAAAELIDAYKDLNQQGQLSMRSRLVFSPSWKAVDGIAVQDLLSSWARWLSGRGLGDEMLRVEGIFAEVSGQNNDNDIRAGVRPYTGWSGFYYDSNLPEPAIRELLLEAARNDIRAVGIWPNMLDLFEEVNRHVDITGRRWIYGHVSALDEAQISQIVDLGLGVTTHTNRYIYKEGHLLRDRLGADRENDILPLRRLLDRGVTCALATDNVPVSLFWPVWQAVSRRCRYVDEPIAPEQAITREEALTCATRSGAWLTFEEDQRGSLAPGMAADFAVLSDNPLTVEEDRIKDIEADITVVGGKIVFARDTQESAGA